MRPMRPPTKRVGASGTAERQARITEALLLALAFFVLLTGSLLAITAKSRDFPAPDKVLLLNQATAPQLQEALSIPPSFAARVVAERQRVHGFEDVDAIGRIPVVPSPRVAADKLRANGFPTPQAAHAGDATTFRRLLDLNAPTAARFEALRAAMPTAKRWERVLGAPLLSSGAVNAAEPQFEVRTGRDSIIHFLVAEALVALFFIVAHLLLRRFRPGADPFLLPLVALLAFVGTMTLFSLKDPVRDMPAYAAQAQGIVVGGGLALLASLSGWFGRLPLHRYGYLFALVAVGATVLLGVAGVGPVGAKLSVAGVQPIEGIKILLAFFLAAYLADRAPVLNDPLHRWGPFALPRRADILPLIVLFTLPLVLFALVRDLGPILLLFGTFLILLYLATGRAAYVGVGALAMVAAAAVGYHFHFGVFYVRVDMWLSPWQNTHKGGDQTALGLWGLASGGTFGSGLGLGATHFIPRGGSDLAFASVGEEMGLPGSILVALCLLTIAGRGFGIARKAATEFDRYLAAGLSCLVGLQATIILCGTLGLLPLAGITVPFVSYGKSSLIACFFSVGVLLSLSARRGANTAVVPQSDVISAPPEFRRASARLLFVSAIVLLPLLVARLVWVQMLASNQIAGRSVRVPDADGVARPHLNPRLALLAARIGRGRILDRGGRVLAETVKGTRTYPLGAATAHLVGYLNPAVGGPTGMEQRADSDLRGFGTYADLLPLWRRKDLPGFQIPQGRDVTLALDADLQQAALAALTEGAHGIRDRKSGKPLNRGAAVVLDVATGGIIASVTLPTFDPTTLTPATLHALNADGDHALINRAVSGYYPPGSTFKIVTATALLGAKKADMTVDCHHIDENVFWHANGTTYARRRIVDDEADQPHGTIGMDEAIARSCNVYFAHAGLALGPDALRDAASLFGFTRLPPLADFGANLPDIGYGQGPMLVSPMEMASVAQTVANGGIRLRPTYRTTIAPNPATILAPDAAARLAAAMLRVTQSGTAAGRFGDLPFSVAGKTGTAQNNAGDKVAHSWFIGFAPADHPRIAFAVLVENGGYGATVAVPIAHRILKSAEPLVSETVKAR